MHPFPIAAALIGLGVAITAGDTTSADHTEATPTRVEWLAAPSADDVVLFDGELDSADTLVVETAAVGDAQLRIVVGDE